MSMTRKNYNEYQPCHIVMMEDFMDFYSDWKSAIIPSAIRLYSSWSNEKMPLWFMLSNITALLTPWDKNLVLYLTLVALSLVKSFNSINFYWSRRTKEAASDKRISTLKANTPKRGWEREIVNKLHNSFISLSYSRNFLFCRLLRKTKRARKIIWFFYLINYA